MLQGQLELGVNTLAHLPLRISGATTYALTCLRQSLTPWTVRDRRLLDVAAQNITVVLERQQHAAVLEAAARIDPLTGLGNRRAFNERLDAVISASQHHRLAVSVLSLDLDGLKGVNDQGGHAQGDRYLTGFARALQSALRREDTLFRVGGDEFMAILPNTGSEGGQGVRLRVQQAVMEVRALGFAQADVSAGMAAYPVEAGTRDELVRLSDERLYEDKRQHYRAQGKGEIRFPCEER